jgi:hypothetical protein
VPALPVDHPLRSDIGRPAANDVLVPTLPGQSGGRSMTELDVHCSREGDGEHWTCRVSVEVEGGPRTEHRVRVAMTDLERLDPGAREPHMLVNRAFRFLLAHEPSTSILRSFDLTDIGRYFPGWEASVRPPDPD